MSESKEVANWDAELAKYAQQAAETATPSNSVISFKAGAITYQGQTAPTGKINVLAVASAAERTYYEGAYDSNNVTSPDCWGISLGKTVETPNAQNPVHDNCAECPLNKWGSAKVGKGKACKERKRLALIPADAVKGGGEGVLRAEVALAHIPVTSVKNWDNYVLRLATTAKRPPFAVITELSTRPDPKTQFQVQFDYLEDVDPALLPSLLEKIELAKDVVLKPYAPKAALKEEPKAKGSKHAV